MIVSKKVLQYFKFIKYKRQIKKGKKMVLINISLLKKEHWSIIQLKLQQLTLIILVDGFFSKPNLVIFYFIVNILYIFFFNTKSAYVTLVYTSNV
jgi:hypothetical protein